MSNSAPSAVDYYRAPVPDWAMRAAAYRDTSAFEELKTKIGPNAAYEVAARAATSGVNPDQGFSQELIKTTAPDDSARNTRLAAIRAAVDYVGGDRIDEGTKTRLTNEFWAAERQYMGAGRASSALPDVAAQVNAEAIRNPLSQYASLLAGTQSDVQNKKGFFDRDAMGRTILERQTGGTGYQRGEGGSYVYAGMDSAKWNPASGADGLTDKNYASTEFHAHGLSMEIAKSLLRDKENFGKRTIIQATDDAKNLGFQNDKDAVRSHAIIRKYDPKAGEFNSRIQDYQKRLQNDPELKNLQEQLQNTQDPEARKLLAQKIKKQERHLADNSRVPQHIAHVRQPKARAEEEKVLKAVVDQNRHLRPQSHAIQQVVAGKKKQVTTVADKNAAADRAILGLSPR